MPDICPHCHKKIVKFPLKDENGKFIWINLFKMDWQSILLIVIVLSLVVGYKLDIQKCDDAIKKPCEFCKRTNCCNPFAEKDNAVYIPYNVSQDEMPKVP